MNPEESSRLDRLGQKLRNLKDEATKRGRPGAEINRDANMAGLGWRMSIELVAGIVVGLGMGYFLDRWFDTKPLFMISFMFMGFGAGILNVIRLSKRIQSQLEQRDKEDRL